jgi:hypothetical protein
MTAPDTLCHGIEIDHLRVSASQVVAHRCNAALRYDEVG